MSKCKFDASGKQFDDVGGWCWFWIALNVLSTVGFLIQGVRSVKKAKKNEMNKIYLRTIINTIISILMIYFMYSMCKLCRGWTALGVIIVISCMIMGINFTILK